MASGVSISLVRDRPTLRRLGQEARLQSARAHDEIAQSRLFYRARPTSWPRQENARANEHYWLCALIHRNDLNRAAFGGEAKSRTTAVLIHDEKQQNATALSHRCGGYQQKRNAFSRLGAEGEHAGRRIGTFRREKR